MWLPWQLDTHTFLPDNALHCCMPTCRRDLLAAASAAGITTLAGCSTFLPGSSDEPADTGEDTSPTEDSIPTTPAEELSGQRLPDGYTPQGIGDVSNVLQLIDQQLLADTMEIVDRREYTTRNGTRMVQTNQFQYNAAETTATMSGERGPAEKESERTSYGGEVVDSTVQLGNKSAPFPSHPQAVIYLANRLTRNIEHICESIVLAGHRHPETGRAQYLPVDVAEDPIGNIREGEVSGLYTITASGELVSATITITDGSTNIFTYEFASSLAEEGATLN